METIWKELYDAAKAVQQERRISEYVTCGEVAAAILSKSGKIYTGVCIDTCSTLGICAERNAIFNMITNGEQQIDKVIAILPDGSTGAPCGACRELMVQLMPGSYQDIEIMVDTPRAVPSSWEKSPPNGGFEQRKSLRRSKGLFRLFCCGLIGLTQPADKL